MDTLPTFNSTMTAIGAALVELCQSMPGVASIDVYASVEDGKPYSSVTACNANCEPIISFHRFWEDTDE